MNFQIREDKKSLPQKDSKKEAFIQSLEEQGFTFTENRTGDRSYSLPYCDALFIICYEKHWEARLFCQSDTYSLGKHEYRGVVNGLKLLRNK